MIRFKHPFRLPTAAGGRIVGWLAALVLLAFVPLASAENLALVYSAIATGQPTGHIATLEITNPGEEGRRVSLKPSVIPPADGYQGFVIPTGTQIEVREGSKVILLLRGYGTDVSRQPVPEGQPLPHPNEWIEPDRPPALEDLELSDDGPYRTAGPPPDGAPLLTAPGTEKEFPVKIDINGYPEAAAPFLIAAIQRIVETCDRLFTADGIHLQTGEEPEMARESAVQETFWIYTAALQNRPYGREDYLSRQPVPNPASTEDRPPAAAPAADEPPDAEPADPWDTFLRIGAEAQLWKTPASVKNPGS